jgi:hypothetical protein
MSAKHTPGPWEASITANSIGQRHIYDENNHPIAQTVHKDVEHPERISANALLIAAAPELLDALQNLLGFGINGTIESQMAQDDARAAIAKATGETK